MWQAAQHCVHLFIPTVSVIYGCLTNHPKLSGLTQEQFILLHSSVSGIQAGLAGHFSVECQLGLFMWNDPGSLSSSRTLFT